MSDITKIEWATHTWNPWEGCSKVSPGCAHCYAEARNHRFGNDNWGKGKPRRRTSEASWLKPHRWNNEDPYTAQYRSRVFPSLCDPFDDEVPIEWLSDFMKLIHDTPNLDWLLLTKRPENFFPRLRKAELFLVDGPREKTDPRVQLSWWISTWRHGDVAPAHVWMGVSVEDQPRADERIPELLKIPAKVRFLSVEPLLSHILFADVHRNCEICHAKIHPLVKGCCTCGHYYNGIDWVIVGGESGPKARPCNVEWIRDIVKQCKSAGVPCFVKQLGSNIRSNGITLPGQGWPDSRLRGTDTGDGTWKHHLLHKKGGDPSEWPKDLRVRQFHH